MKKFLCIALTILLSVGAVATFVACSGRPNTQKIDSSNEWDAAMKATTDALYGDDACFTFKSERSYNVEQIGLLTEKDVFYTEDENTTLELVVDGKNHSAHLIYKGDLIEKTTGKEDVNSVVEIEQYFVADGTELIVYTRKYLNKDGELLADNEWQITKKITCDSAESANAQFASFWQANLMYATGHFGCTEIFKSLKFEDVELKNGLYTFESEVLPRYVFTTSFAIIDGKVGYVESKQEPPASFTIEDSGRIDSSKVTANISYKGSVSVPSSLYELKDAA